MTDLIEMKTADLTGEALNWSVAKALGLSVYLAGPQYGNGHLVMVRYTPDGCSFEQETRYRPSADWSRCGPLMDRFKIEIIRCHDAVHAKVAGKTNAAGYGDTALIAACRAIVASVLGETVSVPKELLV